MPISGRVSKVLFGGKKISQEELAKALLEESEGREDRKKTEDHGDDRQPAASPTAASVMINEK